jgi:hypothetical protein
MSYSNLHRYDKHVWPTFYLGLANIPNPSKLGSGKGTCPRFFGPGNMSNPRYLGLTNMSDPFYFFLQWATRFSMRRGGREGGREKPSPEAPLWASSAHMPRHYAWGGKAHRKTPRKATLGLVLEPHAPPVGVYPGHVNHF